MDCVHGKLGQSSCEAENSAGVICWPSQSFQDDVSKGIVRLSGGGTSVEGRVEVFTNGSWGSVCDDQWSLEDATVTCTQLGCKASSATSGSKYGPGVLDIKWTAVSCQGAEETLNSCPKTPFTPELNATCTHQTEAGAVCDCEIKVSIGEGNVGSGVVSVKATGEDEGTLCYDTFNLRTADVACREAGFLGVLSASGTKSTSGNLLDVSYTCEGNEISLKACTRSYFNASECTDGKETAVVCQIDGDTGTQAGPTEDAPASEGLSTGAVVGIVIGVLIGVVIIVAIAFCLLKGRRGGRPAKI